MEYLSDDIAAARSLQVATVCLLVHVRANKYWQSSAISIYIWCVLPESLILCPTQFSVDSYILGRLVPFYSRPLLNSLIQTYDYICSLHEEVIHLSRKTPRSYTHIMLWKVDLFASIALEQGKSHVHCYTIPPLFYSHLESIWCVPLQHTLFQWWINTCTCSPASFISNENLGVCDVVD